MRPCVMTLARRSYTPGGDVALQVPVRLDNDAFSVLRHAAVLLPAWSLSPGWQLGVPMVRCQHETTVTGRDVTASTRAFVDHERSRGPGSRRPRACCVTAPTGAEPPVAGLHPRARRTIAPTARAVRGARSRPPTPLVSPGCPRPAVRQDSPATAQQHPRVPPGPASGPRQGVLVLSRSSSVPAARARPTRCNVRRGCSPVQATVPLLSRHPAVPATRCGADRHRHAAARALRDDLRTLGQCNPPSPLPSGGMAIDRIPRERISPTSDCIPASMSSSRLLPRQCRLVGKLMM